MKKYIFLFALILLLLFIIGHSMGQVNNPVPVVQQDASNQVNTNVSTSINNGLNKASSSIKGLFKKKKKPTHADSVQMAQTQVAAAAAASTTTATTATTASTATAAASATGSQSAVPSLTSYQNYDFVPGNNILFEDEFTDDQSGEFPTHWNLTEGAGNTQHGWAG